MTTPTTRAEPAGGGGRTNYDEGMSPTESGFPCSIARVTELIGDPWTPLVLRDAVLGVRRYEDFHRNQRISRNALSRTLRKLVDAGVLTTRLYQDNPPRKEYLLSPKGRELFGVLSAMIAWGDRWLDDGAGPPVVLRHSACGLDVRADSVCSGCGEPLDAARVEFRLGDDFPADLAERPDVTLRFAGRSSASHD
ncbi:transcriptional regulator, HxlR family [Pseudonocardia oroxyli]|uniref:Transcriptional regulator, HxlR family n=2 Tax=Pseudonocardia oroxyli TaxID=366584 RepID=A0A1G7E528_PSEOR|nr:transcriptional regulator, HxlR family [Pseudonocardia oroxyli]